METRFNLYANKCIKFYFIEKKKIYQEITNVPEKF